MIKRLKYQSVLLKSSSVLRAASLITMLAGAALIPCARAQSTGSLDGVVRDPTGALIPGATVTLINENSKAKRKTISNGEGLFTINAIQAQTYDLVVTAPGFEAFRVNGIEVHPGDHTSIAKVVLNIGASTTEVTVTAYSAGVQLDSPEKSALITAEDIKRLSTVGRDATELIKFLPGFGVSTGGSLSNVSTSNSAQNVGFGSSSVSSFSANGATPQTGATTVISDGASVMDPGDMGASIANVNMDMVQEIKVQTSNFGADSAKGPVVINAVGKSGGSDFHGTAYIFARNGVLNANDWYSNFNGSARPDTSYYYPGANVGGPVRIPGTNFNHSKKMTFFTGGEVYKQNEFDTLLLSFIPTARMLGGDLTPASIASALNVTEDTVRTQCPTFYTSTVGTTGSLANSGGVCYSPGITETTYTQQNQLITAGTVNGGGLLQVDPHANIYAKFFPKINRTPMAGAGFASDGYNYQRAVTSTHNGFQYRARIDENFTDSTKLYVTYNLEQVNDETPLNNVYYEGADGIPYPTPLFGHTRSNGLSLNFTKIFGPTLTNELVAAGTYYNQPAQLQNPGLVNDASTGWSGGRFYNNGALQLPGIRDYEQGVPSFAMGYIPPNSAFLRKLSYNAGDNLTKQLKTHSIKVGVYAEVTGNNQVPYNFTQGLNTFNHYNNGCTVDPPAGTTAPTGHISQLHNGVANFLQGCTGFSQSSSSQNANLRFKTLDFYATDEWKVSKRFTLTYGLRFDHLGPWYSPDGLGLAVWNAPAAGPASFNANITQDPHTYPGISWHQTNSAVPLSGAPSRPLFYSPRVGLAYDLQGNGQTVFRGGWGAYRFHDSYNDSAGALSTTLGIQTFSTPTNVSCTYTQLTNKTCASSSAAAGSLPNSINVAPFTIYALDPHDDKQPVTYNYNFTLDQQMPRNSLLEISYVGNQNKDTFTEGALSNQNYIPLGGLFRPDPFTGAVTQPSSNQQVQQDYRPYPNYTNVFVPNHIGYGNYNSLQVSYNKTKGAFIYGVNYTWSKALGVRGDYRTGTVGDPSNLRNNYGYLGFNRNNILNATYSWQVGRAYRHDRYVGALLNNWEVSGITGLQSGPDIAVLSGGGNLGLSGGVGYTVPGSTSATAISVSNTALLGTPDIALQPVVTCDPRDKGSIQPGLGKKYFNGSCFALPSLGTNGNFELPDIHGPAYFNSDLTVQRTFKLREKQNMQFRLAGFNFLNHPLPSFQASNTSALNLTYGLPVGYTASSPQQAFAGATQNSNNFGYTPYKQGYRIVEVGARYNF